MPETDTDNDVEGRIEFATERDMDGMGTCEFPEESPRGLTNCGDVTEHIAAVQVDGKITLVPLCNRHAGSLPEEYIYE
mgnify:CR=1 FL=1